MGDENVSWEKTRDTLQRYIKAPKLKENLLKKPPFRFLHDIVVNFVKGTGYFEGLYTADELDSEKVKDRDSKIAFLQKIISAVSACLGVSLAIRPLKVVSGLEPEATNQWLQAMAECVSEKKDWKRAMEKMAGAGDEKKEKEEKKRDKDRDKEKDRDKDKEKERKHRDKEKDRDRDKEKEERREKDKERKEKDGEKDKEKNREDRKDREERKKEERKEERKEEKKEKKEEAAPPAPGQTGGTNEGRPAERPSTARKPPPQVRSNVVETDAAPVVKDKKDAPAPSGVIIDRKKGKDKTTAAPKVDSDSEDEGPPDLFGPDPFGEPEKVTQADGEGGGYLSKMAEQARQAQDKKEGDPASPDAAASNGTGIILTRNIGGGKKEKESFQQEITKLREALQTLTKTTNPLGKAMDYIQEDLDSMQRELDMWKAETKQQSSSWAEQQRQTEETLQPFYSQLHDLEDSINDQIMKIHSTKASILRQDQTVETLLKMVVTNDGQGNM